MLLQIRRTTRGTFAALVNMTLNMAAGVVIIGNEWVSAAPQPVWYAVGGVLLLWACLIFSALLRPVLMALDDQGVWVRRLFGSDRFAWADLVWVDFETSGRVALVAARQGGKDRVAGLSKRSVAEGDLMCALDQVRARRPDIPDRNPGANPAKDSP